MRSTQKQKGFTLIELLVVISIIGVLASIAVASFNSARTKARDIRRKADLSQIQKAIELYMLNTGSLPINRSPCCYYGDAQPNFLQELVAAGYLARIPKDPQSPTRQYWYYDYGKDPCAGYYVLAQLEGDTSQNPDYSYYATCPTSWNAVKNGSCLPGSTYCLRGSL